MEELKISNEAFLKNVANEYFAKTLMDDEDIEISLPFPEDKEKADKALTKEIESKKLFELEPLISYSEFEATRNYFVMGFMCALKLASENSL